MFPVYANHLRVHCTIVLFAVSTSGHNRQKRSWWKFFKKIARIIIYALVVFFDLEDEKYDQPEPTSTRSTTRPTTTPSNDFRSLDMMPSRSRWVKRTMIA